MEKYVTDRQTTDDNMAHGIAGWMTKATDTHSAYVMLIAFPRQNGCANPRQRHVTSTLLSQNTPMTEGLELPRQSTDSLNSDQFACHYCNTVQQCERFRSLLTAVQSVERKFVGLN